MEQLYAASRDGIEYGVYCAENLAVPVARSNFFTLALLGDWTAYSNEELFAFADECIRKGLSFLVVWGPGCERVHDLFDESMIDEEGNRLLLEGSAEDDVVMTTGMTMIRSKKLWTSL